VKWVYLCSRRLHERKVDRHRATLVAAIGRQPDCDMLVTGNGWPGYDPTLPVAANLRAMGCDPDVMLVYQQAADHIHLGAADVGCLRAMLLYDVYELPKRRAEIDAVRPHVVFHTHHNDASRLASVAGDARLVHTPFGVDPAVFYREDYGERPIGCLLVGQLDPATYPLRAKWRGLIESGRLRGAVRQMPPYRLEPGECERQYAAWGEHMRRAKIVLTCGSRWRYALQTYFAAAMCGCLVAADMPDDPVFRATLGRHIHAVDPACDSLDAAVSSLLADPAAVRERGLAARRCAMERYTVDRMADAMVGRVRAAIGCGPRAAPPSDGV